MPLTIDEARRLGSEKLGIAQPLFDKCLGHAQDMVMREGGKPADLGPLTLALALMGASKSYETEDIQGEMVDALQLIDKAEKEWRMEMQIGRGHA